MLKNPFYERENGDNFPGLRCVYVLNRLINGLGIYPFTYIIQIYASTYSFLPRISISL